MIRSWLTVLPERLDYVSRLLPYLLSSLIDRLPAIRLKAYQALDEVGALYERDHEKDVVEELLYFADDSQTTSWTLFTDLCKTSKILNRSCSV